MKNKVITFFITILITITLSSISTAAPIVDGVMDYNDTNDWGAFNVKHFNSGFKTHRNLDNVSVEKGDALGGDAYDLEAIGVYISDNVLYMGLKGGFDFKDGVGSILSGDLIFNFDDPLKSKHKKFKTDNQDTDDFAFDFEIHDSGIVDMTLYAGDMSWSDHGSSYGSPGVLDKPVEVETAELSQEFTGAGRFADNGSYGDSDYSIEAAINLNHLSDELNLLFTNYVDSYDSVTMYWQPSCGNDFLAARSDFTYTGPDNPVPEPGTFFLFGLGLLAVGALGRKTQKEELLKKNPKANKGFLSWLLTLKN